MRPVARVVNRAIVVHDAKTEPSIGGRMFPWLWFWAPQFHFPWSGDVAQRIQPDTRWFFQGIAPDAGDASVEQKAFAVASYGRQLGLLTEVLVDLAEQAGPQSAKAAESLRRLKLIQAEIEQVKATEQATRLADIESRIVELQRQGGSDYARLTERLLPLLATPVPAGARKLIRE
jgi:hypothetical protein